MATGGNDDADNDEDDEEDDRDGMQAHTTQGLEHDVYACKIAALGNNNSVTKLMYQLLGFSLPLGLLAACRFRTASASR